MTWALPPPAALPVRLAGRATAGVGQLCPIPSATAEDRRCGCPSRPPLRLRRGAGGEGLPPDRPTAPPHAPPPPRAPPSPPSERGRGRGAPSRPTHRTAACSAAAPRAPLSAFGEGPGERGSRPPGQPHRRNHRRHPARPPLRLRRGAGGEVRCAGRSGAGATGESPPLAPRGSMRRASGSGPRPPHPLPPHEGAGSASPRPPRAP